MTLLLDYSVSVPSPTTIKAAGYAGVMRYLSNHCRLGTVDKDLSAAEAKGLLAAGLGIGLVWETTARRAADGRSAGIADVRSAELEAATLGFPAGLPIFYAVDYDAVPVTVLPYFDGVQATARRPVGVYGSFRVVETIHATGVPYVWQACAWSSSKVSTTAHLYQRLHATVAHPISGTDENLMIHPMPLWTSLSHPVVTTAPPVRPKDVPLRITGSLDAPTIARLHRWAGLPSETVTSRTLWRAVQRKVGGFTVTGLQNPTMWKAIQRKVKVGADGIPGPITITALQRWLNAQ